MLLVLRARLIEQLRWARGHVYTWLVLGPIVIGMSYASMQRMIARLAEWVDLPFGAAWLVGSVAGAAVIALGLSRAAAEVYHIRQPESLLEAFPLRDDDHLHLALASRFARSLLIGLAVLVLRFVVGSQASALQTVASLSIFVAVATTAELFAAINWIHYGHTRSRVIGVAAIAYLALTAALIGLSLMALFGYSRGSLLLERSGWLAGAAWAAVSYVVTRELHRRWRGYDLEFAQRLQAGGSRSLPRLQFLHKRLSSEARAQLARDLQLTLRGFSSAVYVVLIVAAVGLAATFALLNGELFSKPSSSIAFLDATWLPPVIVTKVATVLVTGAFCTIVPALVSYGLPHLWLERTVGTTGEAVWESKLWYARISSMPAPVLAFGLAVATGKIPAYYSAPLFAECLLNWWLVSTVMGSLAFESPYRASMSAIIMLIAGLTVGTLSLLAWPLGLLLYVHVGGSLAERGHSRAHFCLIEGEE